MHFPFSSYNDYYVHHPCPSSHNLIPLLILNNFLFMLFALPSHSFRFRPKLFPLALFKQKPLSNHNQQNTFQLSARFCM